MKRTTVLLLSILLAGCAIAAGRQDLSGPVGWRIVDLREERRPATNEIRWHYTLVLTERAGRTVKLVREDRTTLVNGVELSSHISEPSISLRPGEEPRFDLWNAIVLRATSASRGVPTEGGFQSLGGGGPRTVTIWRRYTGTDDQGRPSSSTSGSRRDAISAGARRRLPPSRRLRGPAR